MADRSSPSRRILLWHGWLLEGSGSNVYTARVAEVYRSQGHDVLLLCQEPHPQRYEWVDATGWVDAGGPSELTPSAAASPSRGRCVLLRPRIGPVLPVFVLDEYEGFDDVRRFVDLPDDVLHAYLEANVDALRASAAWHRSEVVVTGHAIPGSVIGARAAGGLAPFVAKIHGSDIEYAMRPDARYRALAAEGLGAARAVVGPSVDALRRCEELVPNVAGRTRIVSPGVDVSAFRPRPRREALLEAAARLERNPDTARGRPSGADAEVDRALAARDAEGLERLAATYDQEVPDPDAASRLRRLAELDGPIVASFGKLIPQKGVQLVLAAATCTRARPHVLVVGFGAYREWLAALATALRAGDDGAVSWLRSAGRMAIEPRAGRAPDVTFTGRLDHRYAPAALAAADVLAVPSVMAEAFGMVAAEGAAAGALPLVSRHSGLAEVAGALEEEVGRPGLFSFEPGEGATARLTAALDRLLAIDRTERTEIANAASAYVGRTWSWTATAERLLAAASDQRAR